MSIYENLHEIIDLPRILEDDIIPNHESHIVYVTNPHRPDATFTQHPIMGSTYVEGDGTRTGGDQFVPIIIPGFQWDYLWWIYRFRTQDDSTSDKSINTAIDFGDRAGLSFPKFLNDYLSEAYRKYLNKHIE